MFVLLLRSYSQRTIRNLINPSFILSLSKDELMRSEESRQDTSVIASSPPCPLVARGVLCASERSTPGDIREPLPKRFPSSLSESAHNNGHSHRTASLRRAPASPP